MIAEHPLQLRQLSSTAFVVLPKCLRHESCAESDEPEPYTRAGYPDIEEYIVRGESVTGSRFRQPGLSDFHSVEVITQTEIRLSGAATLSQLLRFTPSVVGNSASTAVGNGGDGSANVTLRGLPANNTLVLINGQRTVNNGLDGETVNINSIPLAAVDHIEILKDGASATYGSDAIAGVVNVVLKRELYGAYINVYGGISDRGDAESNRYDLLYGNSFGNHQFLIAASTFDDNGFFSRDRAISRFADTRAIGGNDNRSSATPNTRITLPSGDTVTLDETVPNADGSSPSQFRLATSEDLFDYAPFTSAMTPNSRDAIYLGGQLLPKSTLEVDFDLHYVDTESTITLAPTPLFSAFEEVLVPIAADQPFNPFGVELADIRRRFTEFDNRTQTNRNETFRASTLVLGSYADGDWQAGLSWSRSESSERYDNLVDGQRLTRSLGPAAQCQGLAIDGCLPLNLFAPAGSLSPTEVAYLSSYGLSKGTTELRSATIETSTLVDLLPGEPVALLIGVEMRDESLNLRSDQPVDNQYLIGGSSRGESTGDRTVTELFFEAHFPLWRDLRGINLLEANIALRTSDYSDFGTSSNPKLSLHYRPVASLSVRASASTGFRAPSLFELYRLTATSQQFLSDPCSSAGFALLPGCSQQTDPLRIQFLTQIGGNPDLRAESSRHSSFGISYQPLSKSRFTFSVDWFNTRVRDVIGSNSQLYVLENAESGAYADRIQRDSNGEIVMIDASLDNFGSREIEGADVEIHWLMDMANYGLLNFTASAAYINHYSLTELGVEREYSGTFVDSAADGNGSIPKLKSRFDMLWQTKRWEVALNSLYISSLDEVDPSSGNMRKVASWFRQDLQINFRFNSDSSLATFGVENLFDRAPPFSISAFNDNYDPRTYDATGRYYYFKVSYRI